jgi:hypothetical protein
LLKRKGRKEGRKEGRKGERNSPGVVAVLRGPGSNPSTKKERKKKKKLPDLMGDYSTACPAGLRLFALELRLSPVTLPSALPKTVPGALLPFLASVTQQEENLGY